MHRLSSSSATLLLVLVLAVVVSSAKILNDIRNDLEVLRNDAPPRLLDESMELHASMLRSLDQFNTYKSYFGASARVDSNDSSDNSKREESAAGGEDDSIIIDIHTDVVFIGFPASSLEVVRDKWFESLGRTDDTLATIGLHNSESTINLPGGPGVRHHFHLVQISFHVADALKARLERLKRPLFVASKETEGLEELLYFNSWEVDELLQGLSDVISATHTAVGADSSQAKSVKPSATVFVLNLDVGKGSRPKGDLPAYIYRNGFSDEDLALLAKDEAVLQLSRQVVGADRRGSRLDLDAARDAPPLRRPQQRADGDYLQEDSDSGDSGDSGRRNLIHWRDAVKETRQWAGSVGDETQRLDGANQFSLAERTLRILRSTDMSSAITSRFKYDLARSILRSSILPQPAPSDEANGCSSETWFGAGRAVWTDLHATRTPPFYFEYGNSLNAPAPGKLTDSEWLRLGDGAVKSADGAAENIARTRQSLQRHRSVLESLISQSKCPGAIVNVMRGGLSRMAPGSTVDLFVANVGEELREGVRDLKSTPSARSCAGMQLQQVLLDVLASSSAALSTTAHTEAEAAKQRSDGDFSHFFRDQALLHSELLELALESSDAMHEKLTLHISRVSEEAAVYLGHLSASVLRLARFFLAPPLSLHQNPIAAPSDLKVLAGAAATGKTAATAAAAAGSSSREQSLLELVRVWRSVRAEVGASQLRKSKTRLTAWLSLLPPSLVPSRVEVVVYAIKLQETYAPLTGFDYWSLMKESSRLRLPNQQMTLTLHEVDATNEVALGLGLRACRRIELVSSADDYSRRSATFTAEYTGYLDSQCIWSYLQHHDEEGEQRREIRGHSVHLPVFLISLDTPEPTYLDGLNLAVNVGNAVLVVQNRQEAIPSQLMCGARQVLMDGRNPLSPALAAVARALTGATMRHTGHCGRASSSDIERLLGLSSDSTTTSGTGVTSVDQKAQDWSLGLGSSPLFQAFSFATPHFSQAEIEVAHRSRLHKNLAICREIASLYAVHGHDVHADGGNSSSVPTADKLDWLTSRALRALQGADYATAASLSNELYLLTLSSLPTTETLSDDINVPEKRTRKSSRSSGKARERTLRRVDIIQTLSNYLFIPLMAFAIALLASQAVSRTVADYLRKGRASRGIAHSNQGFSLG